MKLQLEGHKLHHHLDELLAWNKAVDKDGKVVSRDDLPAPLHFDVGPTAACNHSCVHCYVKELPEHAVYLRRDIYEQLMIDMPTCGVKSIYLAGRGEPLMHKDTTDMIPIGKKHGLDIGLLTNGVLFTPDKSEMVLEHLVFTRFNMLGNTKTVYAKLMGTTEPMLKRAKDNFGYAARFKNDCNINTAMGVYTCMFPENALELYDLASWAKDVGGDYIAIKPAGQFLDTTFRFERNLHQKFQDQIEKIRGLANNGFTVDIRFDLFNVQQNFVQLTDISIDLFNVQQNFVQLNGRSVIKRNYDRCYGIDFLGIIDGDGNVGTCNGFWKIPQAQYGNLYEKSFPEIMRSEQRFKAREYINEQVDCHKCYVCRQHNANEFLWGLKNPPDHVNFI